MLLFRKQFMRSIAVAFVAVISTSFAVTAQQNPAGSVCQGAMPAGVILNICNHEHGMAPIPQPRLYLRVYSDGRAEYETNGTNRTLIRKQFRLSETEVAEIVRFGSAEDFQKAQANYPSYRQGTDSWRETTVNFYDKLVAKKIVLLNFSAQDRENAENYPRSLFALMERAEEHWEKANGIVRSVPAINYCEMIKNRKQYVGKKVSVYADLKHAMVSFYDDPRGQRYGEYLYDSECENASVSSVQGRGTTGIGLGVEGKAADGLRQKIARLSDDHFGPRARVWVTGILREEPGDDTYVYRYRFYIEEFKSFEQLVIPFKGSLESTWVYSDTFDYNADDWVIKLSQPFKSINDNSVRILWRNEKDFFSALKTSGRKSIVFRVIALSIKQKGHGAENVYLCEILELK